MDMPTIPVDGLEAIATRLDRCAEHIATQAGLAGSATSELWRGPSAERHREVVARHARDLDDLARALREASALVRHLSATARARLVALGEVDLTVGIER